MNTIPSLNGNWVDLLILTAALFYLWDGVRRGLILTLLDLVSFIVSFFIAVQLYKYAAYLLIANFNLSRAIAKAIGFLLAGFLAEVVLSSLARQSLKYIPKTWVEHKVNKLLGIIPAIGNTIILSSFILTFIITLPVKGAIKSKIITSKLGGPLVQEAAGVEKQIKAIFGGAVEESLTFLTVKPGSSDSVDLNFTQNQTTTDAKSEKEMFSLINQARENNNLNKLEFNDGKLQEVARSHAEDMFKQGYFSHYSPEGKSPFDRIEEANIDYSAAGENLALAPTVMLAHQGLMNSPGHRANILSADFNKVGIGVIDGGIYGKMFVQVFTD